MTIKFFKGVNTLEELKNRYRKLAKEYHPDMGGSHEDMVQINNEFEYLFDRVGKTKQEENSSETAAEYMEIVKNIIHLPDIEIELCGTWLWVTGNTYPVKDELKAAGFKFAGKKKAWYWHSGDYKKRSRKKLSMNEIRSLYGSQKIEADEEDKRKQLTA